jgi:hypothetical protein
MIPTRFHRSATTPIIQKEVAGFVVVVMLLSLGLKVGSEIMPTTYLKIIQLICKYSVALNL